MSRNLSNWLSAYNDYTQGNESPERYHLWAGLTTIAAVAQRKIMLVEERLRIHSNLFTILVGPSGGPRKTTALEMAKSLLRDPEEVDLEDLGVKINLAPEKGSSAALIRRMATIGNENSRHQSITGYVGELGTLLGNRESDMTDVLMNFWDCRNDFEKDTISRDVESITAPWVNMIGATTPTWLSENLTMTAMEGGLVSRATFIYEGEARGRYAIPRFSAEQRAMRQPLVQDLWAISKLEGTMRFSPAARDRYVHWYEVELAKDQGYTQRYATQRQRQHAVALKIAMLSSLATSDSLEISEDDMNAGIALLVDTQRDLHLVFQGVGKNIYSMEIQQIQQEIQRNGSMTYKRIVQNNIANMPREVIDQALDTLRMMGEITVGEGVGPAKKFVAA